MIPEAERWFNQAKKDLEAASWNFDGKFYAHAWTPSLRIFFPKVKISLIDCFNNVRKLDLRNI